MTRLKATAIAAITTLIFASLAIGITSHTSGGTTAVDAIAANPTEVPTDGASPTDGISIVTSQPVSFEDPKGDSEHHDGDGSSHQEREEGEEDD